MKNEPAYPHHYQDDVPGLTKREAYAMAAMQGMGNWCPILGIENPLSDAWHSARSQCAIKSADALLAALEATK